MFRYVKEFKFIITSRHVVFPVARIFPVFANAPFMAIDNLVHI